MGQVHLSYDLSVPSMAPPADLRLLVDSQEAPAWGARARSRREGGRRRTPGGGVAAVVRAVFWDPIFGLGGWVNSPPRNGGGHGQHRFFWDPIFCGWVSSPPVSEPILVGMGMFTGGYDLDLDPWPNG